MQKLNVLQHLTLVWSIIKFNEEVLCQQVKEHMAKRWEDHLKRVKMVPLSEEKAKGHLASSVYHQYKA